MAPKALVDCSVTAVINAPIESVNIGEWLFTLTDAEYQRCAPPDHIAAGATTTDDGRPMSINVEYVGTSLVIEHYVGEIVSRHHCKLVSISDSFTPNGRTTVQVIWELTATSDGENRCTYTNRVAVFPTDEFLAFLDDHGVTFDQAAAERRAAVDKHNHLETPLYAKSIERKALAGTAVTPR